MRCCCSGWAISTRCSARMPSAPRRCSGLTLTSRDKGADAVPMAGFPHPALDSYLAKIVQAGLRAAVCEQVEDAAVRQGAGEARRRPGRHARDPDRRRAARPQDGQLPGGGGRGRAASSGLAWVELSTGRFSLTGPDADRAGRRDRPAQPGRDPDLRAEPRCALGPRCSAASRWAAITVAAVVGLPARAGPQDALRAVRHDDAGRLRHRRPRPRRSRPPGR